jgi:hypothetical protein
MEAVIREVGKVQTDKNSAIERRLRKLGFLIGMTR